MPGFKKPPRPSDVLVGIDFGTTKICVVVGKETSEGLQIVGIGKQPSLGIRKGVVVNIPSTVEAVEKAVEVAELMADCKVSTAYAGIAGGHIKGFNSSGVVAIKNKEVSHHDVERAIDAAKALAIPLDREILDVIPHEFTVDNQDGVRDPIGMSGVRLESKVHIVTGRCRQLKMSRNAPIRQACRFRISCWSRSRRLRRCCAKMKRSLG